MPKGSEHKSGKFTKLLVVGDSGAGKTTALHSLLVAGYKLKIIDYDNGLDHLISYTRNNTPELLDNIEYQSFASKGKVTSTGIRFSSGQFLSSMKTTETWEDATKPRELGEDYILVIDTLSKMCDEARRWAVSMDPELRDNRRQIQAAQKTVEDLIATMTDEDFHANLIVLTHITEEEKTGKKFPATIGLALSRRIGANFNNVVLIDAKVRGSTTERKIKTVSSGGLLLKNANPQKIEAEYPLETGMASIFAALRS